MREKRRAGRAVRRVPPPLSKLLNWAVRVSDVLGKAGDVAPEEGDVGIAYDRKCAAFKANFAQRGVGNKGDVLHFGERQPAEGAGEGADHRGVRRKDDGFFVVFFIYVGACSRTQIFL